MNEYAFVIPRSDDKYTRVFEYDPIVEFIVNTLSSTGVVAIIDPVPLTSNMFPKLLLKRKNEYAFVAPRKAFAWITAPVKPPALDNNVRTFEFC